nr:M81 family metallopeptidase [bacterium]
MTRTRPFRIGIAGFSCECSTFSPLLSRRDDFRITSGRALLERYPFLERYRDVEIVPFIFAGAIPGGIIERSFYEQFKQQLLMMLQDAAPLDGLFLHMHGAAYAEEIEDLEGDFFKGIRRTAGDRCLLSASYDLHGNLSPDVVTHLDILTADRRAPHTDRPDTLARAFRVLHHCLKNGIKPWLSYHRVPILLPGEKTCTDYEPAATLYHCIPDIIEKHALLDASILIGYAWADEPRSGASVVALASEQSAADSAVRELADRFWKLRHEFRFGVPAGSVDTC